MSIKVKLIAGFLGVSLLCLTVGPIALVVSDSQHINQALGTTSSQIEMIKTREIDHHQWMAGMDQLFLENEPRLTIQVDDHKCGLGKFLFGDDLKKSARKTRNSPPSLIR